MTKKKKATGLVQRLFGVLKGTDDEMARLYAVRIVKVIQLCPYTCVLVEVLPRGTPDPQAFYDAYGFSKCMWPDKFDAQEGIDHAAKKALIALVKEIRRHV